MYDIVYIVLRNSRSLIEWIWCVDCKAELASLWCPTSKIASATNQLNGSYTTLCEVEENCSYRIKLIIWWLSNTQKIAGMSSQPMY